MSYLNTYLIELNALVSELDSLVRVVLSGRRRNFQPEFERIDIRPVELKSGLCYQATMSDGRAMTTKNFERSANPFIEYVNAGYANILVETTSSSLQLRITKKGEALINRKDVNLTPSRAHDKVKNRLLSSDDPFLIEVGISDSSGRVKPSKSDKYKQVEEFLRLLVPAVDDAIKAGHIHAPSQQSPLRIVDLGCGHAYLTLAAHQYFASVGIPVEVIGIDIRESSRVRNHAIAVKLGIESTMHFRAEEIGKTTIDSADVAIALHACDTATDDAIAWAINRAVPLALLAPCCHHDIQAQMKVAPEPWSMVTRHGIMRERLGDLITDALRMQIMKLRGYRVDAIEFIGGEHTPRNLMIRAVLTGAAVDSAESARLQEMKEQWGVAPVLEKLISE